MLTLRSILVPVLAIVFTVTACERTQSFSQINARPQKPTELLKSGEHKLGLGEFLWVNYKFEWKDGLLFIPQAAESGLYLPLLIWLHGGGGNAESYRYLFPIAENINVVVLALDARHNTWDGIDSPFGPDAKSIDLALQQIFKRVRIDPERIALGGLSDGGAYALALGRSNGDLFTHLIGAAPGSLKPPSQPVGKPEILVLHGTRDSVYSVTGSRNYIVPRLRTAGYQVSYFEFDGPHWVTEEAAIRLLKWFVSAPG